jgi:very-short-patch-repair endonuclease
MKEITKEFLISEYSVKNRSFADIANQLGTYTNKVVRAARKHGIDIRDRSQAQKAALKNGRHKHPTKGKKRSQEVKEKISNTVYDFWENIDEQNREKRAIKAKENWDKMPEEKKVEFQRLSSQAIRKASKEGSKLEKFLFGFLTEKGYRVEYHKEHLLLNEKLHIDLFLPESSIAIEIDGPSHFEPIWGQEALERTQKSDRQKSGLILNSGLVLVRIKNTKGISERFKRDIKSKLLFEIENILDKFPSRNKRYIEIGE